ncbi:MAG: site-specific integrase [Alphaproteobacteria bacterium]|nr:site-specific integrase [Alphaproteobacteria bacterium]
MLGFVRKEYLIRHAHGVLRTALNHAVTVELVERNVCAAIKPPTPERKEIETLTADQIADALKNLEGHWIYPVVALALGTGARRGEIAALRWADIDLHGATVRIERSIEETKEGLRVKAPKTAAGRRTVSLPAFTVAALREHRRKTLELRLKLGAGPLPVEHALFGCVDGATPAPYTISNRWRHAVKARKLPKVTFHALRHSHASALIAAGLDVVSVSRRLGHANPTITLSVYAHVFKNKNADAAAAMDAVLQREG